MTPTLPSSGSGPPIPFLLKPLLAIGSILLGLILLELGLRIGTGDKLLDTDLTLLTGEVTWEPNQSQRWKRIEWDILYRINSKGFRDYDYPPTPAPASMVVLGDSTTEGYGIALEKSYVKRLESILQDHGYPYRVHNGGLQGRSTSHYIDIYDRYFRQEKNLHTIIIGFSLGDDFESGPIPLKMSVPNRKATSYYIKRYLCEHSVLYNFIRRPTRQSSGPLAYALTKLRVMGSSRPGSMGTDPQYRPAWEYTAKVIDDFNRRLKKEGKDLILMLIPFRDQVEDDYFEFLLKVYGMDRGSVQRYAFNEFMADYAKRHGIRLLDMTPVLLKANAQHPGAYYFKTDNHWGPNGHELAAQEIFRTLEGQGLLRLKPIQSRKA